MKERALIPLRSLALGFGAMVPLAAAAVASVAVPALRVGPVPRAGIVWGGTVLAFLGGVRRGLSFFTPGGATRPQMFGMARLFGFAFAGLLSPSRPLACSLLALGFADVAVKDPELAQRGNAPAFFAELRPPQTAIAILSLLVLAAVSTPRGGSSET